MVEIRGFPILRSFSHRILLHFRGHIHILHIKINRKSIISFYWIKPSFHVNQKAYKLQFLYQNDRRKIWWTKICVESFVAWAFWL